MGFSKNIVGRIRICKLICRIVFFTRKQIQVRRRRHIDKCIIRFYIFSKYRCICYVLFYGNNFAIPARKRISCFIIICFNRVFTTERRYFSIFNLFFFYRNAIDNPFNGIFVFSFYPFSINARIFRYIFKRSRYVAAFFGYPFVKSITKFFGGRFRRSCRRYVSAVVYVCRSKQGSAVVIIKSDCAVRSLRSG